MPPRRIALWLASAILLIAFAVGIGQLFALRFEAGDIYPPYSSLRTDPLGAKALQDSLDELPGLTTRRNYRVLDELDLSGATLLWLGESSRRAVTHGPGEFEHVADTDAESLSELARTGNRVVIALTIGKQSWFTLGGLPGSGLAAHFGVTVVSNTTAQDPEGNTAAATQAATDATLPPTLPWRSDLAFATLTGNWRVFYERDDQPVIIERSLGEGTVVLLADSYLLSNEAMFADRHSELLAWLIGGSGEVVFDEAHLGVVETTNIMALMRRYRLGGVGAALLIVVGLFIWKQVVGFLPRDAARQSQLSGARVAGRGSGSAILGLLRRSISRRNLLTVCLDEWSAAGGPKGAASAEAVQRAHQRIQREQSRPVAQRDVVAAYRDVCRILSETTHGNRTVS